MNTATQTPTNVDTDTTSTPKSYTDYYNNFDMNALLPEIFGEHVDDRLNAYMACCGRHVRDGRADHAALVHEDTAGNITRMSFGELDKASAQIANLLQSYGVKAGDKVATMLPRTPELLTVVLATWRIGAVYQPLFTAFGYDSIKYRMDKADTKVVFTNLENRSKFEDLAEQTKMVLVGSIEDAQTWGDDHYSQSMAAQSQTIEPVMLDTDAPFLQMFTSGTVGKSKGVSVPLAALPAFYLYMRYAIDLREDDQYWNMADPGWAYGLYYAITGPLLLGITTYFNEAGFDATNTRDFMVRHQITNLASSPTAFRMMKSSGVFESAHKDAKAKLSLRCANSAGETLNTEVVNWVETYLACQVKDQYGQTETGMTDDIIITAGYRVGPTDVENTVLEHEAVAESAAVGVPDEVRGHTIKSYVVLKDGIEGSEQIAKEIQELVRKRLSTHAYPREVEFVTELPKTPSGKIQRFLLRSLSAA